MADSRRSDTPVRLIVEIDRGGEPIRGTVDGPAYREARPFHGWIQLTELIEAARLDGGRETGSRRA